MKKLLATITGGLALGLVGGTAFSVGSDLLRSPSEQARASSGTTFDLESVPGFGRSAIAMARDDQVAAYQAYQREKTVAKCMSAAGFDYAVNLRYPVDALEGLSVATVEADAHLRARAGESASATNARYVGALPAARRDAYYKTLLGESAQDVDFFEKHKGQIPPGRNPDTFATGGCQGRAMTEVGRVWDLRDQLARDWDAVRAQARNSKAVAQATENLTTCAAELGFPGVTGPWSLDEAARTGSVSVETINTVEQRCLPAWQAADLDALKQHEERFVEDHRGELTSQIKRFGGLLEQSRVDLGFAQVVANEIALQGE